MEIQQKHIPQLRFPDFLNDGEWVEKKYEDCLDYEQPQSYLVSSENYKKTGVPVLTAGKTFILGFTDETFGVYTKLPVIIFDDFTTDSRFVEFPFKAKSSAMKMLSVKEGYDLRFVFATMQNNEFKPHDHQRHWISIYSKFKVKIPSLAEQRHIAACLSALDEMLAATNGKLEQMKAYKKGLMQKLFPAKGKKLPELRFKEFEKDGEWEEKKFGEIISVNSGRDYKHLNYGNIPVYGTGGYMLSVDDKLSDIDAVGIGRKGTIDKPQYLKAPFWTVDTLFFLTNRNGNDIQFIYYSAQTVPWKKYGEQTGVPSLSKLSIENLDVVVPPTILEQRKIAQTLLPLDKELDSLSQKIELLGKQKKGLMKQLFIC